MERKKVCGQTVERANAPIPACFAFLPINPLTPNNIGLPDTTFPVEGTRITPCAENIASLASYPTYPCPAPKTTTFTIISPSATTPALAIFDSNAGSPTCTGLTYPCASYYRIIGMRATNKDALTRTSHKLVELAGCDHCIFDRGILHSFGDPMFRVEVQGGVNINCSHCSVINSYIYDIVCANAPSGTTCVDAQGVAGGTGAFPQVGQKVVNNFIAASGECYFWGGAATAYYPTAGNPDGGASDIEVRRNHCFHPLGWFLPYLAGPFTLTSVNNSGTFFGNVPGGANNSLVGRIYKTTGFTSLLNNITAMVIASSNISIMLDTLAGTAAETHAGTATETEPHWDPKNQGESKGSNRSLWEGNVAENSWQGYQSDQFGNAWLLTPKNQNAKLAIPTGDVVTGANVSGSHFINCTNGGVACSLAAGNKSLFTCELDPNAVPDWTGNGTTVASCGSTVAFGCAVGTQLGCPGSYQKLCQSVGDTSKCAVDIGGLAGTYYHILAVVSADQVQVAEDATSVVAVTPTIFRRGLNPFASVRNHTVRYSIGRHLADGMETSSAADDGGSEAQGVHNVSTHDNEFYDVNPGFWSNQGSCCNSGWFVKMFSGTAVAAVVPSAISIVHNTAPMVGFASSQASGLTNLFDNKCKLPLAGLLCANSVSPAYFPALEVRDNISGAAMHMTAAGSSFSTNTQAFAAGLYGCSGHNGSTGCDFNIQKNLLVTGVWPGQTNQLPNLHLLGGNTVEACSCTLVANGGTCTAGSPNTWSSPVTTGSLDACDRSPAVGYTSLFNNWDPLGGLLTDLQLPSNSPYLTAASNGSALGANIAMVLAKTAGVAASTAFSVIAINGYAGNTSCTDVAPCALPAATHAVSYGIMLSRTAPNGPWSQWTVTGGSLPAGLSLALGTGILSGTPMQTGTFSFSVTVVDASHASDQQAYSLLVN